MKAVKTPYEKVAPVPRKMKIKIIFQSAKEQKEPPKSLAPSEDKKSSQNVLHPQKKEGTAPNIGGANLNSAPECPICMKLT